MELYTVRHLPTEWNRRGIMQGQQDTSIVPPDAESREMIRRNHERLRAEGPFDRVVTSTLRRTIGTAREYGYDATHPEPLLDELAFGEWEGVPRARMEAELGARWMEDPRDLVLGESLTNLDSRIRSFLKNYSGYGKVLAFAHGSWMRGLVSIARHGDLRGMNRFFIENSEVHMFHVDGDGGAHHRAYGD